jgi:hypothetical protein
VRRWRFIKGRERCSTCWRLYFEDDGPPANDPGREERIAQYCRRAARGQPLFSPGMIADQPSPPAASGA